MASVTFIFIFIFPDGFRYIFWCYASFSLHIFQLQMKINKTEFTFLGKSNDDEIDDQMNYSVNVGVEAFTCPTFITSGFRNVRLSHIPFYKKRRHTAVNRLHWSPWMAAIAEASFLHSLPFSSSGFLSPLPAIQFFLSFKLNWGGRQAWQDPVNPGPVLLRSRRVYGNNRKCVTRAGKRLIFADREWAARLKR